MLNQLSGERCSNVIVLLCTANTKRVQSLLGKLARTHLTSIIHNLDRGRSRTSAASRMKFFVTTVSSLESLAVVTKMSILVPTGVLDPSLLEIQMSILNKHHISGIKFY